MKSSHRKIFLAGAALMISALACNLPGVAAPTPFSFPTPNLTLTAIFSPTETVPVLGIPTATSGSGEGANPTPVPTETLSPPTLTPIPPTATLIPTNTAAPTVSYVGPGMRSGTSVSAAYLVKEPTIDGVFDDWDLDRYSVANVVAGAGNWSGQNDLSSMVMLGWDDHNLYIAARVKDDKYVQNASGANLYKGDSIEILLDTNVSQDYYFKGLDSDDYQLGISPGSPQPGQNAEAYLWFPQSVAGERQTVKVGATITSDGYRIEAKIPWTLFGISPAKSQHFGFAFSVSDNDNSSQNVQQSMVSNVATRLLTDPTTWGDLTLSGAPAPKKRSGTSLSAVYLSTPPTLDGNLSEWSIGPSPVTNVVFGKDKWSGAADLSGSVIAGWDENNLYLGVKVLDDTYVQNATGKSIYLGDSLEVLLDSYVSGDFYVRSLSNDDYQLGISPGNPGVGVNPEAYLWYPESVAGSRSQVKIAAISTADGYQLEVAIPWSVFGITPKNGQHFGFAFSISDNDNSAKAVQQSMVSNISTRVLTDPTTWGDLTLTTP